MFESKSGVLLIGGLGFFLFAFLSNAVVPILLYRHLPEQTVEQLVETNENLKYQVEDLSVRYADTFKKYYGQPDEKACAEALRLGRTVYIGEGCWHCHSQFVRPVSNESERWGQVAASEEYQNELQRPVMFGTRRVGPDLSREGGRRGNDWHAVHFFNPPAVSTGSPMPRYPWFFDGISLETVVARLETLDPPFVEKLREDIGDDLQAKPAETRAAIAARYPDLAAELDCSPDAPNKRGLAVIAYVQWLGSWLDQYPEYERYIPLDEELQNPLE
jgi:cytochrome c oxidase cbb3-type subunit 2